MTHLFHAGAIKPRQKAAVRGGLQPQPGESGNGLEEAARAILADAQSALSAADLSDGERVHAVRRAFKRWRALLRLLRRPIGEAADEMRAGGGGRMGQLGTAPAQRG